MRGRPHTSALLKHLTPAGGPAARTALAEAAAEASGPLHDPRLEPRDEAVFLLTVAAEIEHALMVQYLYAAYSVRVAGDSTAELKAVQDLLLQIAREEMGHLATVQNLLLLIGGPLSFDREHSPERQRDLPVPVQARAADTRRPGQVRQRREPGHAA
jgi:hypothetical protein